MTAITDANTLWLKENNFELNEKQLKFFAESVKEFYSWETNQYNSADANRCRRRAYVATLKEKRL